MSFLNTINTSANLTNRSLSLLDVGDLLVVFMCVTAHAKLTVWVLPGQKGTCSGWSFCFPQLKSRYARLLTVGLVALLLSSLRLQRVLNLPHQVVFSCHRQPQCLNVWVKSECFGSLQNQWHTDAWSMLTDRCQVQSVLSSVFPGHPRRLSIREYPFHCKLVPLSSAH